MHFKFNEVGISTELLSTRLRRPPCCILREGGGAAPVEVCTWSMMVASRASLFKWMPFSGHSSWYFCLRLWQLRCPSRREISSGTSSSSSSSSFGHRELKFGREYNVNMFNGFINAWFDYWFWQVSISYDYAVLRTIKENFLVFCITIFPEQAQNKNKVGIKPTFLLMMKIHEAKSPTQVHICLGRVERIFLKSSKQQNNTLFEKISSRRYIKSDPIAAINSMCHNAR